MSYLLKNKSGYYISPVGAMTTKNKREAIHFKSFRAAEIRKELLEKYDFDIVEIED